MLIIKALVILDLVLVKCNDAQSRYSCPHVLAWVSALPAIYERITNRSM